MTSIDRKHLLNVEQMVHFVNQGYVTLDQVVPQELNEAVLEDQKRLVRSGMNFWNESSIIRSVFELPAVKGAIRSLVGDAPVYDHSCLHVVGPRHLRGQEYHADSVIDTRPLAFDIQAFYFSHDTPLEMGPTLILPGSHQRRVNTFSISRYKNIRGQKQLVSKAGTIAILHHGIWHCAQPNSTDTTRYVFKLRLRPGQQQRNLFNTDGYDDPAVEQSFYASHHPWLGDEGRIEHIKRAKLWRYVVGNDSVDVSFEHALSRMSE